MKLIERTHNAITGEVVDTERDETAAETKARLDTDKATVAAQAEAETNATAKAALLARLGITVDEATLLLS
jgi:hypothetical protein